MIATHEMERSDFCSFFLSVASVKHVKIDYCLYALNPLVSIQESGFSSVWNIELLCPSSSVCDKSAAKLCGKASPLSKYPQCTLKAELHQQPAAWTERRCHGKHIRAMTRESEKWPNAFHTAQDGTFYRAEGNIQFGKAHMNTHQKSMNT